MRGTKPFIIPSTEIPVPFIQLEGGEASLRVLRQGDVLRGDRIIFDSLRNLVLLETVGGLTYQFACTDPITKGGF